MATYAEKISALTAELASGAATMARVGLARETSNLFRDRTTKAAPRINLKHFDRVLAVDPAAGTIEAEGMTTFVDLADAALARGTMPRVVPQLKSITLGGALAGVGIEATSFRYGLVHDTIASFEVLTGDGRVVTCRRDNEHRDLFYGFPNAYGTLGYALKVTQRTRPVKPFVHIEHHRYRDPATCFADVAQYAAQKDTDFLDGVVFEPGELYLTRGAFVQTAPYTSDYTFEDIYYRSIRDRASDFLTIRDYLWRWDTDWFWCSKNVGAQNPILRRLYGRDRLNSITYQKIMRWNSRHGFTRAWNRLRGVTPESVIQDVDIPIQRAAEFLEFFHAAVGILPVWICPIRAPAASERFPLYPLKPDALYVNFGFWDVVRHPIERPPGYCNRKIERRVDALGGIKSLYSDSYFTPEEFWSVYDREAYQALKARYDPRGVLGDLYAKTVLRR
ncbi:MAG TPA: FAD-binding oxidoreductase [Casimicrobiaceae bacterium]|nr:FAD-binding oxidoreductase [Casimicrobiaceae bacterium]